MYCAWFLDDLLEMTWWPPRKVVAICHPEGGCSVCKQVRICHTWSFSFITEGKSERQLGAERCAMFSRILRDVD